ncbi:MAG: THUMP domain-containing class I SAM-dependent RNA methyltransferase [Candidatus Xenobia bacterium]
MELTATCLLGLESLVARDLRRLGCEDVRPDNGQVAFSGPPELICRSNLWLRTADRVWLRMGRFEANTFDELFEGTKALPWPDLLPRQATFPVEGSSHASQLESVPACQAIVKKAVVEAMKRRYRTDWFDEKGALYRIRVAMVRNVATLSIDTSGTGLHRRGYRTLTAAAPLRETLAAAMVLLSTWRKDRVLLDPFCGSGTIPIEAAMIGLNHAPGLLRGFASEEWDQVGAARWKAARAEAEEAVDRTTKLTIFGSDSDGGVLKLARHHLEKAGLTDRGVFFETKPVSDLRSSRKYGVLVTNPPYGERMGERQEAEALYRTLGEVTAPLDTWSVFVLTSHPQFAHFFGRPPQKARKLYNGMIECRLYQYPGPRPPRPRESAGTLSQGAE